MINWKSVSLVAIAAVAIISCSGTQTHQVSAGSVGSRNAKPAPDFTLKDANGSAVKLSDYQGKVVLLNFWATWCGPCKMEIPWFVDFEQRYKSKGFSVVGVAMDDEGWTAVKPYVADHKVNYRILLGNDSVTQLYGGVDSLPTTFIIDRTGKIANVHVGLAGKNEYADEIEKLLGGMATTTSRGRDLRALSALVARSAAK